MLLLHVVLGLGVQDMGVGTGGHETKLIVHVYSDLAGRISKQIPPLFLLGLHFR